MEQHICCSKKEEMIMMMPSIFGGDLFDSFMDFPFTESGRAAEHREIHSLMKTDVKETENGYEVDIELPGYKKEDIKAHLKDGYLTISAEKQTKSEQKDEEGRYIRKERYSGSMSRQFYVGRGVTETDIHARFEDGILKLALPKQNATKVEEKKYIAIEG
jgi:HSP20 family molecular chaperone IbpA